MSNIPFTKAELSLVLNFCAISIASAIVTDRGGRVCHAAIISRELGVPCVVGTREGSEKIKSGQGITVSCAEGEKGFVYKGILPFRIEKLNIKKLRNKK